MVARGWGRGTEVSPKVKSRSVPNPALPLPGAARGRESRIPTRSGAPALTAVCHTACSPLPPHGAVRIERELIRGELEGKCANESEETRARRGISGTGRWARLSCP